MTRSRNSTHRNGVALLMALVVMATLAVILSVVAVQIVSQRQALDQRQRRLQADWLARAGVELAAARLLDSASGFVEEKQDLLEDAKVRIVVEKTGQEIYSVSVEAELGTANEKPMVRSASGRFRRNDAGGTIHLEAVLLEKKKGP